MFSEKFKKTEAAKRCIYPVIRQLNELGDNAYGGRFYDGDCNTLHVNLTHDIRNALYSNNAFLQGANDFEKHIKFHFVKYTQAQMRAMQTIIDKELLGKLGINATDYDVKNNKLMLGVDDATEDAKKEILSALAKLNYSNPDMFEIIQKPRVYSSGSFDLSSSPVDMSNGIPDRLIDAAASANILVAPGSWIGQGASVSAITGISSLCTGVIYAGAPGFLSCGHGKQQGMKIFYQPVPSSGNYPSNIWSYSNSSLVEIGYVYGCEFNSGDPYDFASIYRTNSSTYMDPENYRGGTVDGDSGIPEIGEQMAFVGCADGAVFGTCTSTCMSTTVDNSVIKTDVLAMSKSSTPGSSGGCVAYLDGSTNKTNLTGLVLGHFNNSEGSVHTKYGLLKNRFNLTTVF